MNYALEYFKQHFLAVLIGVVGFLSAIVTMFINTDSSVSIKWLIFLIFISSIILFLLISFIFELLKNKSYDDNINRFKLKYLNKETDKGEVFLNKSSINFEYGDVIKIYYLDKDKVEIFIGIGIVEHIQIQQNICHVDFLWKNEINDKMKDVYFSLKINKDELKLLINKEY